MMRVMMFAAFVASLTCASDAQCDLLTWQIEVDKSTYVVGELVRWTVSVNATEFTSPNFGLATAQASLTENRGETLSAASFAATPFNNYDLKSGGNGGAGFLNDFVATEFAGNTGDVVETTDDTVFTLFAKGNFSATVLGSHILTVNPDTSVGANTYFIQNDGFPDFTTDYATLVGGSVNFDVSAVPEPSTLCLMSIALAGVAGTTWRKRRRKSDAPAMPQAKT